MSLDDLHERTYQKKSYNCTHFAADVWERLTGQDIKEALTDTLAQYGVRHSAPDAARLRFKRLDAPGEGPSIALFLRPGCEPHMGVFIQDRVWHLHECGVAFERFDVVAMFFKKVRFYLPCAVN